MNNLKGRKFLSAFDFIREEILKLFKDTDLLKNGPKKKLLKDKKIAVLFMKPSIRTRVSFEVGMYELGGTALILGPDEVGMGKREAPKDVARVLSRMVDCIVARVFSHNIIEELAEYADVPVINGLSDHEHPCQAYSDIFTIKEVFQTLENIKIVFIGDGNNVARSLLYTCSIMGIEFILISPKNYSLTEEDLLKANKNKFKIKYRVYNKIEKELIKDADCIYTDVWASMGKEAEKEERLRIFSKFQVNERIMNWTKAETIFMHCLPAHRSEEVTDEVIESIKSKVFLQSENRLHFQKALLWNIIK
ncbi:MAG: ornithine carbamoyltransferase [Candidatus Hydrogenedentota bacterium]